MITVIEGLAGSGKTFLMTRLVKKEWDRGEQIFANFPLWYDEEGKGVKRWHNLDEITHLRNGIICIDESQKMLDARRWQSLPMTFTELIAMHRHHHLELITTTQDLGHIDVRVRSNVHELYRTDTLFRFPKNQRVKPLLHIFSVTKRVRTFTKGENRQVRWTRVGYRKFYFLSRWWTKTYYNTYGDVGQEKILCKIMYKQKKWTAKVYSKELVDRGKARL